ncbi:hypothetical protein [Pseudarthrobacter sp. PS3-L1]|uniref:hypothetical protein n=1 Tax=Pseudarthrobacter sp. PS3-L1 TaxID=3046207 RepID=UPI0024B96EFA|nr:hypothetical protein [Pseudarthrobacter sp. PS3-L1]MDJ0320262.1 hypothetical protein [Pseudarthrobacter sp. PS3-L1]
MTTVPRPGRTAVLAVVTALAVLLALTGCSSLWRSDAPPADPQWKYSDAMKVLAEIPGVNESYLTSGPVGLPNQIELTAGLQLVKGYPVELVPKLVDYALALAWSVPVEKPTTTVSIAFMAGKKSVDLQPAALALGWPEYTGRTLSLSPKDLAARYGPWPGDRPAVPAELATYVPPPPEPTPATPTVGAPLQAGDLRPEAQRS